jgi:hypothetical protein
MTPLPPRCSPPRPALHAGPMSGWLYAIACVVVPAAWGVAMFAVFNVFDRRRAAPRDRQSRPPVDYSI